MANKKAGKSAKNLSRSARLSNHNTTVRLHKISLARKHHIKNALQSCGKVFAEKLELYYQKHPTSSVGKRHGSHRSI